MDVNSVQLGAIVKIKFKLPDGQVKLHPVVVVSSSKLQNIEKGMFYAVMLSTKRCHEEYVMKIGNEMLDTPLPKQSYFITHIMGYFTPKDIEGPYMSIVKEKYMEILIKKVIESIFDWELE